MEKLIIKIISPIRAIIMRKIKSKNNYFLATRNLKPVSYKFGFDRGKPIDRYYIEKFLEENKNLIKGNCLEIVDNSYTLKYGNKKITKSDILDNNFKNKGATIHGNLKKLIMISDNTYDCLIITHTLGMIDDYETAIRECHRILKPGGALLVTLSSFSPVWDEYTMWRFTVSAAKYVFGKYFKKQNLIVKSYGNVLVGQCFWVGLAMEELTKKELNYNDPHFPCIITIRSIKEKV